MTNSAIGVRLPRRARRSTTMQCARLAVRTIELLIVVVLIGAAALAIRLSSGPIHLNSLGERVSTSLQERFEGRYKVALAQLYLTHNSWGVGIGFDQLRLRDPQGRSVISAPSGRIGLDPLALLIGEVKVQRLELEGLHVRLRVAKDGALSVAASGDESAAPIALPNSSASGLESANLAALIRASVEAMAGTSQAIDHLTLANGRFEIDNEATDRSISYKNFNLAFDRSGDEASARVTATGPAGPWTITARAGATARPTLSIEARDVSLADLETFNKRPPPVFVEGPIDFRLEASLAPDTTLQSLDGRFTLGAGRVRLNNPDALPFLVDEASGRIVWSGAEKRLRIEDLSILANETHIQTSGWVAPPANPSDPWTIRMESSNTRFGAERPGMKPVMLNSVLFEARAYPLETRFLVDNFLAKGPTVDTHIAATIAPDGPGVSLKFDLTVNPSVTQDVVRLWPQFINPDVRDWCSHNLHGGQIEGEMHANWSAQDLDAMDHKRAVSRDSVHGSFASHNVGVDLLPGLPMMASGEGSGSFTGHEFSLTAKSGVMTLAPGRRFLPTTSPSPSPTLRRARSWTPRRRRI